MELSWGVLLRDFCQGAAVLTFKDLKQQDVYPMERGTTITFWMFIQRTELMHYQQRTSLIGFEPIVWNQITRP